MTTIHDGIAWGMTQIGKPYDSTWANRFGPNAYDCSGLVSQVLWHAGMPQGALPTNSADMARWLLRPENAHYRRTHEQARTTIGALAIAGGTSGYGGAGHVVISLGDGRTLESTGHIGVNINKFDRGIIWSDYMIPPQVNMGTPEPPVPPIQREDDDMMLIRGNATPEVYITNGVTKTHITADAYPFWLFMLAQRPGAVDPTTRKEWVVDEKMLACIPRTPGS